jgi:hypothetical protein
LKVTGYPLEHCAEAKLTALKVWLGQQKATSNPLIQGL